MLPERDSDGKLPAFAWPGGYPLFYLCADGGELCATCANDPEAYTGAYVPERGRDWHIVDADVNWECNDLACAHCGNTIESAYGMPD